MTPTPTHDPALPQRVAGFATLADALDYAAQGVTGLNLYSPRGELTLALPYAALRERALVAAIRLLRTGVQRSQRVGLIAETGADFLTLFYACQYAGLVPCPLPHTLYLGGKSAYVEQLTRMLVAAKAPLLLGPANLRECLDAVAAACTVQALSFEDIRAAAPTIAANTLPTLHPLRADESAYVQYSSGSTSQPKGVLIPQRAVCANVQAILRHGLRLHPHDRAFSWLPLYHDMGLVGFSIAPLFGQRSIDYLAPASFARRPTLWLRLMSDNRSTITYAPAFGYQLAAQRLASEDEPDIDLSALRIAGIGGDRIRPQALDEFTARLSAHGFRRAAFLPSYGMAEATLAVSIADAAHEPRIDAGQVACGAALPGCDIQIVDDQDQSLPAGHSGHIRIRSPGLMAGYLDDADATAAVMGTDGFMETGDIGYLLDDGQIVINGRAKDMILLRGRNLWPQDIEAAVEHIAPLKPGDAAAIAVERADDEDELVLLAQCALADPGQREALAAQLRAAINRATGASARIVLVPPRSLPHTSSGKLARARAKARYLAGDYPA